ncbi:protein phosphatase 1 regulatory subunit 12B-like [Watersipora subatra]|uniref:protein phosphatase 1 regulatory subunit 12B-like n=1 Tax=Watersipora subatra TaxID=2589382 RepID=UPI00355C350A
MSTSSSSKTKNGLKARNGTTFKDRNSEDEFMAASIGDEEWLRQSVRHSKQINFDKNGLAALHLASLHGRLACVKLLIEKFNHDVNLASSTGWRPIHLAISNQTGKMSFAVLQYLLRKGADFSVINDDGITPMHQAASEGHIQCLKALIERSAKIYVKDYRGHTPLDLAKLWGHRQCARILATEQWHQEKDEVAKELSKLKKKKMIDELENLSILEDERAGKQFCGADAYKDWLNSRGLAADKEGRIKSGKKVKVGLGTKENTQMSGLHVPNSISDARMPERSNILTGASKSLTPITRDRTMDSFPDSTDYYAIYEKTTPPKENKLLTVREKRLAINANKFRVKDDWNFSPQCKLLGHYQPDLQDCYPRNPITKLPHRNAAPAYLATHKNVPVSAFSDADAHTKERRVVFQPETIFDAQTKVKYSEEKLLNKPQVFINLSNDLGSQLFQGGLYIDPFPDIHTNQEKVGGKCSSSTVTPGLITPLSEKQIPLTLRT